MDNALRTAERAKKLKEEEAERRVRDAEQTAIKLRKAEANRAAVAAAEQQAAEELGKVVADNAARAMAVSVLLNQRRESLLALARAFKAQKADLLLTAAGRGRGGVDGADENDGAVSHTSLPGTQLDTPDHDPGETPSAPPSPGGSKHKRSQRLQGIAPPPAVAT